MIRLIATPVISFVVTFIGLLGITLSVGVVP
jgi:hypothetical protein